MFLTPGEVCVSECDEVGTSSFAERESQPARPFQISKNLVDRLPVGIQWTVGGPRNFLNNVENVWTRHVDHPYLATDCLAKRLFGFRLAFIVWPKIVQRESRGRAGRSDVTFARGICSRTLLSK